MSVRKSHHALADAAPAGYVAFRKEILIPPANTVGVDHARRRPSGLPEALEEMVRDAKSV